MRREGRREEGRAGLPAQETARADCFLEQVSDLALEEVPRHVSGGKPVLPVGGGVEAEWQWGWGGI